LPGFEYGDIYNFEKLSSILETGKSQFILNNKLGEIFVDKGLTGKKGNGLLHIIENRTKDGRNDKEIAAILHLVIKSAERGKIIRNITEKDTPQVIRRIEIEKEGIIALLSLHRNQNDEKWILTGYDNRDKKKRSHRSYTDGYRPIQPHA
jgi:hypothetical protein